MPDPFKDLEQDITNLLTAAAKNAAANGVDANADAPRSKGGAPPGNQNALKHGFYTKRLTPEQRDALAKARNTDYLADEIATMRVKIEFLLDQPDPDYKLIFNAMWVLARMVRIEHRVRLGV